MVTEVQVVVSLGSNHQADDNITYALDALFEKIGSLTISPVYRSQALAVEQDADSVESAACYLNAVVAFSTQHSLSEVQSFLKTIERNGGRDRSLQQVAIDIDLLLYGTVCDNALPASGDNGGLPHVDIVQCAYVLRPLADILPQVLHPVVKKSYADLWQVFDKTHRLQAVDFVWQGQVISIAASCLMI